MQVIPAQRRARILEILRRAGTVSVQRLAAELNTSASTVRRDLDYLEAGKYLDRTYGGAQVTAKPAGTTFEPEFDIGQHTRVKEKTAIGKLAAGLLHSGASVFFDSGSTVMRAAEAVAASRLEITAVTNDLKIAAVLAGNQLIRTIVPGGTVRQDHYTLLGEPGLSFTQSLQLDVALMGVHSLAGGVLSDSSIEVVNMKRSILNVSRERIVLVDSTKFSNDPSFVSVGPLADMDVLVTDDGIDAQIRGELEASTTKVYVAAVE